MGVRRAVAPLRAAAAANLQVEPAAHVLGGPAGGGPIVTLLEDMPTGPFTGVVLANELLDNLPPVIAERMADGWAEVRVGEASAHLVEVLVASADVTRTAERWRPGAESASASPSCGERPAGWSRPGPASMPASSCASTTGC